MANSTKKKCKWQISAGGEMIGVVEEPTIIDVFKRLSEIELVDVSTCTIVKQK